MTCLVEYDRDCFGKYCEVKGELKFEDNFTAFGFYFVKCNWRWINGNSNNCSQGKASAVTFPSHIKAIQTRGLQVPVGKVPSSATTSTTTVNTNVQHQVQLVKSRPFITWPDYILQDNQCDIEHKKRK